MNAQRYKLRSGAWLRIADTGQIFVMAPVSLIPVPPKELQRQMKKLLDFLLAAFLMVTLAPLFFIISILIKCDSAGPVFFKQKRVGYKGRIFKIWKFRTMKSDTPATEHQQLVETLLKHSNVTNSELIEDYKNQIDKHVTRVGRFLRQTSLDELPQLINVLKGELSLVGPRPHPLYEVQNYKNWYLKRLQITPGVTGLSKVQIRCTPENYEKSIRLDLDYIQNWSIALDLKILARTVFTVLRMKNAY